MSLLVRSSSSVRKIQVARYTAELKYCNDQQTNRYCNYIFSCAYALKTENGYSIRYYFTPYQNNICPVPPGGGGRNKWLLCACSMWVRPPLYNATVRYTVPSNSLKQQKSIIRSLFFHKLWGEEECSPKYGQTD